MCADGVCVCVCSRCSGISGSSASGWSLRSRLWVVSVSSVLRCCSGLTRGAAAWTASSPVTPGHASNTSLRRRAWWQRGTSAPTESGGQNTHTPIIHTHTHTHTHIIHTHTHTPSHRHRLSHTHTHTHTHS